MLKYRKTAEECLRLALKVTEQRHRRELLDLASNWLELADSSAKTAMLWAEVEALKRSVN